jgi:hypothetical protein
VPGDQPAVAGEAGLPGDLAHHAVEQAHRPVDSVRLVAGPGPAHRREHRAVGGDQGERGFAVPAVDRQDSRNPRLVRGGIWGSGGVPRESTVV